MHINITSIAFDYIIIHGFFILTISQVLSVFIRKCYLEGLGGGDISYQSKGWWKMKTTKRNRRPLQASCFMKGDVFLKSLSLREN
jgi:hypothetical protein